MFAKNLKFYRLKSRMTQEELAEKIGVSKMAISYYEKGDRKPNMENIVKLAEALNVAIEDFLVVRNLNLKFTHGEFRKTESLPERDQEYIREAVEDYFSRFFNIVEILGGEVLPEPPHLDPSRVPVMGHTSSIDSNEIAQKIRKVLDLPLHGPLGNLTEMLENQGFLIMHLPFDSRDFSGMSGYVDDYPYIVLNANMNAARIRFTLVHELVHLYTHLDSEQERKVEKRVDDIAGTFLLPTADLYRELGVKRSYISKDMQMVGKEYGISMYTLAHRAQKAGIISNEAYSRFKAFAHSMNWEYIEPIQFPKEETTLFNQLVFRAVSENEISVSKAAELLRIPYDEVRKQCYFEGIQ